MARYHYNPESGEVGVCRADPSRPNSRGCRFQLAEGDHFANAAEASRAYEATQDPFGAPSDSSSGRALSSAQSSYFGKSAIRDETGKLLEVYHGSTRDFDSFDPGTLGKGNDSWGNGFYFTTNRGFADSYSEGRGAREFYIAVENPLRVDGREAMSLTDVELSAEQSRKIVLAHPDLQVQPDDEERTNPLADYAPEYWDRDHHSPEELRRMAEKVSRKYFAEGGWVELESFYGRDHGQAFLRSVSEATGHDGVEVDFGPRDGKHIVAWFPEQIKLSSNESPSASARIDG